MKIDPIIFDNFEDANVLLDACQECIDHNGVVTIANVYDLAGSPGNDPEEADWGWNDISSIEIEATDANDPAGYYINFPDACPVEDLIPTKMTWSKHIMNINLDDDDIASQKAKSDLGKPKLTLVPRKIIFDIARIREYGNAKYPEGGPENWRLVDKQRYRDAAFRHFLAYLDDPTGVDEESGLPHLSHLACNVAFLCEMEDL